MKQVYIFVMPIFSRLSSINVFAQESKPTQTNATSYKEYFGHEYNLKTEMINPPLVEEFPLQRNVQA